jgi:3-methylcrotonyl-CoA carboxylase alpha subunit
MERYFATARHVEVQIFADSQGGTVSLFDRDCSVQRRHQKIIEEAPAPGLRDSVRVSMSQAALQAARAVGYVGAGTVEFLLDAAQDFYFMEMNTRLQVEHPVTELITGIDLVEWQIRIAQGEALPKLQNAVEQRGCAVEARLYAEDPAHGYLPSVGRIEHLRWPASNGGLRLDSGVDAGDEVSSFYDPMLGKLIGWGESRDAAIDVLQSALKGIEIAGVTTNRALLDSILGDAVFRAGDVGTHFLELRREQLNFGELPADRLDLGLAALWCAARRVDANALWEDTRGWRAGALATACWRFDAGDVQVTAKSDGRYLLRAQGGESDAMVLSRTFEGLCAEVDGAVHQATVVEAGGRLHVFRRGHHAILGWRRTNDSLQMQAGGEQGSLLTPLPGTVVAVHVSEGESVSRGAPLVTIEAMKMEHTLTAPRDGLVARLAFGVGERVSAGAVLVELTGGAEPTAPVKAPQATS